MTACRPLTYADFLAYSLWEFHLQADRALWPTSVVNKRLPWIDNGPDPPATSPATVTKHQPVEQMTWLPGHRRSSATACRSRGGSTRRPACSISTGRRRSSTATRASPPWGRACAGSGLTIPSTCSTGLRSAFSTLVKINHVLCSAAIPASARTLYLAGHSGRRPVEQ